MKKLLSILTLICFGSLLIVFIFDFSWRQIANQPSFEVNFRLWQHPPIEQKYQVVGLGNSHAEDGFDFSHYNVPAINFGSVAQRFAISEAILRQHQNEIADNAVIVIDVSHISFSHQELTTKDGLQEQFYTQMSPFFIPKINWGNYIKKTFLPFIVTPYNLRRDYAKILADEEAEINKLFWAEHEATKSAVADVPITTESTSLSSTAKSVSSTALTSHSLIGPNANFYDVSVIELALATPSATPASGYIDNMNFIYDKWYHTPEFDQSYFATNQQDLQSLLNFIEKKGWQPVLITIPITQILEDGLLSDYKQTYLYDNLTKAKTDDVVYFDYTLRRDFTNNLLFFANADHLNENGAKVFSYLLLRDLIDGGYLPATADEYVRLPQLDEKG